MFGGTAMPGARGILLASAVPTDQAEISRAPVRLSGHQLAGFQRTSWQTSGPRGPNTMSTFMSVAGQWEGNQGV